MSIRSPRPCAALVTGSFLLSLLCLAAAFSAGCGKSGPPRPQDPTKAFSWNEVEAKMAGRCIAFSGSFTGAFDNFDGVRIEIASISGPDDCPGCPFVPTESAEMSVRDSGFNARDGSVAFSYCPQTANAYRWRLAGLSRFNRLPHATMLDRLLVVTSPEPQAEQQPAGDAAPAR